MTEVRQVPLEVRVIWHDGDGVTSTPTAPVPLPDQLFMLLHFDPTLPASERLAVPVWFHHGREEPPPEVPLGRADRTLVFALVGDKLAGDDDWIEYVRTLRGQVADREEVTLLGIALSENASRNDYLWGGLARERVYQITDRVARDRSVRISVLRTLARVLSDKRPKVFVSHAKADGAHVAAALAAHLQEHKKDAWRDAQQIEGGQELRPVLEGGISDDSCFVAVVSDAYASREWCRWEAQLAKEKNVPMVVLDMVGEGQRRSLPSLGNAPLVRLNLVQPTADGDVEQQRAAAAEAPAAKLAYDRVSEAILTELVTARYFPLSIASLRSNSGAVDHWATFHAPPELITLAARVRSHELDDTTLGVYPDPPLPDFEEDFLASFVDVKGLATPLSLRRREIDRTDPNPQSRVLRVAISISDSPEEELREGQLSQLHLKAVFFQLCLQILAAGHDLVYGGDPKLHGFVEQLADVERAYQFGRKEDRRRMANYVARYLHEAEPFNASELTDVMRIVKVQRERQEGEAEAVSNALDLTTMRERMTAETDVRVVLGGQLRPGPQGTRRAPGIVEEAYLAATSDPPVPLLVAGGFGGAGRLVADALRGRTNAAEVDGLSAHFSGLDDELRAAGHATTFPGMVAALGPDALSTNRLEDSENALLLTTTETDAIVRLVLASLDRLAAS